MKLYLCEKELQAQDIAAVLGQYSTHNGYFKLPGDQIVTWAKGHLLQLNRPEDYHPRFKKWSIEDLPITPVTWGKRIRYNSSNQFNVLSNLIRQASTIFIATDLDREGENIAREILDRCTHSANLKRIRLTALDPQSIRTALEDARDISETASLAEAADARQKADWLVGMNLTRLFTLIGQSLGLTETFHVGRVAIPTIALVCQRENDIKAHEPKPYYSLSAICDVNGQLFKAEWIPPEESRDDHKRCISPEAREIARNAADKNQGIVTAYESNQNYSNAPLPFDLTTLQTKACSRFGYTAKEVLQGLQSLYEKHNLITYPRTDNRYLPSHFYTLVPDILNSISYSGKTGELIVSGIEERNIITARVFDDELVSESHHAIIPTRKQAKLESLNKIEARLYLLICRYFAAQFYPQQLKEKRSVVIALGEHVFKAQDSRTIVMGWKTVLGKNLSLIKDSTKIQTGIDILIPVLTPGDSIAFKEMLAYDHMTKAPEYFTEAGLISAMKSIGRFIDDESLKKILDDTSGIGTVATRADIIETAIDRGYLQRDAHRKQIRATAKGLDLINVLPQQITSPGITALWELKLAMVEQGNLDSDSFVKEISYWISDIVIKVKNISHNMCD